MQTGRRVGEGQVLMQHQCLVHRLTSRQFTLRRLHPPHQRGSS